MIRVCILGTGQFAKVHATMWQRVPGAALAAVASRDIDRARQFCSGLNGARPMTMEEALKPGQPFELVDILTPNAFHCEQALKAMESGYHVLSEKALASTVDDAVKMVRAKLQYKKRLFVVVQNRFVPAYRLLSRAIPRLFVTKAKFTVRMTSHMAGLVPGTWKSDRKLAGGGLLFGSLIHQMDLLVKWFGLPENKNITAKMECTDPRIQVETKVNASWESPRGPLVEIEGETNEKEPPLILLELHGKHGQVIKVKNWRFVPGSVPFKLKMKELFVGLRGKLIPSQRDPLAREFGEIVRAINTNEWSEVDGKDGMRAVQAMASIYKAAGVEAG